VTEYLGDYDYYVEKKQELAEMELAKKESTHHENTAIPDEKLNYERQKEIARIKRRYIRRIEEIQDEIEKLESMIEEKQNLLLQPEVYMDYQEAGKINSIIEEAKRKIDILLDEWLELENRLNAGVLIEEDQ
ncbi:MAG: ABC transporter C-terminal domain-containing protein, partial [Caldibacillus sp.]